MASTKISALSTTDTLSSLDGNDYLVVGNGTTNSNSKLLANSIITTLSSIGYSTPKYLISSISNSNVVIQKGLKSANSKLTVTDTTSGDDKNILLTVVETAIDLSNCINTTSPFLSTVNLASNVGATILPVANGGTGVATLTDKSVLITQDSGTDTVAAVAMSTNGQILMGGTSGPAVGTLTPGTNVTISNADGAITINAALAAALGSNLNMANYSIDLGTGWLSDSGSAGGLTVTAANKVYVGASASEISASSLNVDSGLTFVGGKAQTLEVADASSTSSFTIKGSDTAGSNANGGNLDLKAGAGEGSGVGGTLKLVGGATTTANGGAIQLSTYSGTSETVAVTIDKAQDVTLQAGNLVMATATKGLVVPSTTVTQDAGALTNGVTINATAGKITLAAVALAATTNAEFTVTNSTVGTSSIILITLEDKNTTDNVQLSATINTIASNSFNISIVNPHSSGASSATASKIHYLVVN